MFLSHRTNMYDKKIVTSKDELIIFINMTESYLFDRIQEHDRSGFFDDHNYDQFKEHNERCVNNLSEDDLLFTYKLVDKMIYQKILVSEEGGYNPRDVNRIYFNHKDNLVLIIPR
jgi:hypothetical protein